MKQNWSCDVCKKEGKGKGGALTALNKHEEISPECRGYIQVTLKFGPEDKDGILKTRKPVK